MKQFKTIEPLSNFDIIELCNKLKIKNFKGCFMRDDLSSIQRSQNETMILNLDDNAGPGTHWTCLCLKNNEAFYFDPFGMPPTAELEKYLNGIPTSYSSFAIQAPDQIICGHYCIYFLFRCGQGINFYDVLLELLY
jgi:hypothetical protein